MIGLFVDKRTVYMATEQKGILFTVCLQYGAENNIYCMLTMRAENFIWLCADYLSSLWRGAVLCSGSRHSEARCGKIIVL